MVRARRVLVRHHLAVPTALYCGSDRAQNHQAEHGDRRLLGEERTPRGSTRPKYARPTNPHYPMHTVASPYRAALHHSPPLAPHEHPALAHAHAPRCDPREWDSGGGIRPSTPPGRWARRQGLTQQAQVRHCKTSGCTGKAAVPDRSQCPNDACEPPLTPGVDRDDADWTHREG